MEGIKVNKKEKEDVKKNANERVKESEIINDDNVKINLKEIYEQNLPFIQKEFIDGSNFRSKPVMVKGIISPESTFCVSSSGYEKFCLDQNGVNEVIEMFEEQWNNKDDESKKRFYDTLYDIYQVTDKYFGGWGIPELRQDAYMESNNRELNLSQIKGKHIGQCVERAAVGHQILSILEKSGVIKGYESYYVNSHMTVKKEMNPHAFILLKDKIDSPKHILFDIENPVEYKKNERIVSTIALYPLTQEEYESFIDGKNICPKNILEEIGIQALGDKRIYGDSWEIPDKKVDNNYTKSQQKTIE